MKTVNSLLQVCHTLLLPALVSCHLQFVPAVSSSTLFFIAWRYCYKCLKPFLSGFNCIMWSQALTHLHWDFSPKCDKWNKPSCWTSLKTHHYHLQVTVLLWGGKCTPRVKDPGSASYWGYEAVTCSVSLSLQHLNNIHETLVHFFVPAVPGDLLHCSDSPSSSPTVMACRGESLWEVGIKNQGSVLPKNIFVQYFSDFKFLITLFQVAKYSSRKYMQTPYFVHYICMNL